MKELLKAVITLVGALIVTALYLPFGIVWSIGHAFYFQFKYPKNWALFRLAWRAVDGLAGALGYIIFHLAVGLDMIWNVFGELIEDAVTWVEHTSFGKKQITVSSSIGQMQKEQKLTKFGKKLSIFLNFVFNQKQHCLDSWELHVKSNNLRKKYFTKK